MARPVFRIGILSIIAGTLLLAPPCVPGAFCQDKGQSEASYHNQRGMEYFKKGFYDEAPKNRVAEVEKNYTFAIEEFRAAISRDPSFVEAHRNLARVYYLQKNFDGAAEEYKKVTELVPSDLDAYVNRALALIELQKMEQAIHTLENAKAQTADPKVLDTLDTYIAKVRAHQAKEVR